MTAAAPPTYAFRLRFHVEPAHRFVSSESVVVVPGTSVRLSAPKDTTFAETDVLKLAATGFATEEGARQEGMRWFDAVLIAGLRRGTGFDLGRFKLGGGLTAAGIAHFSQQAGVEVRNDIHGLDVYEDHGQKFAQIDAHASTTSALESFFADLKQGCEAKPMSEKLRLACELYGLSRFAHAPRIHFLTLVTAVEALADPQPLGGEVPALVDGWLKTLPPSLAKDSSFPNRLRDLKEESISRACARVIDGALRPERTKEFKNLYQKRSTLVHEGCVDGTDFVEEAAAAEELVRDLLLKMVEGV